ncbi:MAG TPA: response regulator [Clostridiales bacterium]|nr:response regulator [Clostridiales bacterium]HQP69086.1 response regulator [Clostridiales bacterium]
MLDIIKKKLFFKLILLFILIVFTPICIITYFVYDLVSDNYYSGVERSLTEGKTYIESLFDRNTDLLSANMIKLRDDYEFGSFFDHGAVPDYEQVFEYLKSNYGFDFLFIKSEEDMDQSFYSQKLKKSSGADFGFAKDEPSICYSSGNFLSIVKLHYGSDRKKTEITVGKLIDAENFFELSRILHFDFTIFKKSDKGLLNKFSTISDEYGFNITPGTFILDRNGEDDGYVRDGTISGKKRKILVFRLSDFHDDLYGAVSIDDDPEYIQTAKKHFTALILTFIGLILLLGIFIKNKLVSPITDLLEGIGNASGQIESGQPIETLQVKSHDEIGKLADEYNKMASSLGRSFSRIKYLQNYLWNIFESMPSALIAVDSSGKITQWNRSAEKYSDLKTGMKQGDEIWKSISKLGIYKDELLKVINEKGHIEIYREPYRDGEKINVNIHMFPLIANGVKGSVIRIDDITELRKKEDQLRQAQKMETIGTLAGGIAHDFNNILSGIVGVVSILKYKLDKDQEITKDQLDEYLNIMEQSGKRAGDIVQRLLTLSRKQNTTIEPVMIGEVLKHVVKICSNTFDKSIKILGLNLESKTMVLADFTQLEQVILNLAINANHAMTIMRKEHEIPGGILTIEIVDNVPSSESIGFSGSAEIEYLKISIKDTGVGMDANVIKQIFEPFFSTKEKGLGTGLGLTIVYNIIQQFGGHIDVESTPGSGTEFIIYFPKYNKKTASQVKKENENIIKGSGTILVIDDEPVLRELARAMLNQAGYNVILAEDGIEGIEKYKTNIKAIDLVLLDMMMPNKNGKETFEEIYSINGSVKVVVTSGFTQDSRVEEVLKAGAKDFIQKPYTISGLTKKVYEVLNNDRK